MEKFKILSKNKINDLPKTAGVYCFISGKETIYIGKAINIKDRVKNHFQQPSYRDNLFIKDVEKIGFINTDSEIEALILEANLIKQHLPKFNVVWRDDKNYFYVAIAKNKENLPYVYITHQKDSIKTEYVGPFIEGSALKKTLKYLRRVFPYYTTAKHQKNACTWCHLDLCPGPELFENPPSPKATAGLREYKKNIRQLMLILKGERKSVFYALRREMEAESKAKNFEKAAAVRDRLQALERTMAHTKVIAGSDPAGSDPAMVNLQKLLNMTNKISKIECYDISNIQGKYAVGSMVVFVNGAPDKSQYKKFRIRMKNEPNDIAMLKEMLTRRLLHPEWSYPEVMLIDGGIAQLNIAIKAKNNSTLNLTAVKNRVLKKNIKIISIAKGKRELLIEGAPKIPLKDLPQEIYNLIVHLDDEAHRFAISYHKKVRKKALLDPVRNSPP